MSISKNSDMKGESTVVDQFINKDQITLFERFDKDKLKYIIHNYESLKPQLREVSDYNPIILLKKYLSRERENNVKVTYTYGKHSSSGRMFANGGCSLQCIQREFRHTIAGEFYDDIDIVNCHPMILLNICFKNNMATPHLKAYCTDRSKIIKLIMESNSALDIASTKKFILSIINGGQQNYKYTSSSKWVEGFFNEMKSVTEELIKLYPEIALECTKKNLKKGKTWNIEGSIVNTILSNDESKILLIIAEFLYNNKHMKFDAVLCFDGIMIPKDKIRNNANLIELLNSFSKSRLDYEFPLNFKIKPMDDGLTLPDILEEYPDVVDFDYFVEAYKLIETFNDQVQMNEKLVEFINKSYALIQSSRSHFVHEIKEKDKKMIRVYKDEKSLKLEFANKNFKSNLTDKHEKMLTCRPFPNLISTLQLWCSSKNRREYNGIEFDVNLHYSMKNGYTPKYQPYNLFSGLAIEKEDVDDIKALEHSHPFLQHIYNRWCKGNQQCYDYVLNWFAHQVQFPGKKMRAALVLRSYERSGKGLVVTTIAKIIGEDYFFHPTQASDVLGNFNGGMAGNIMIYIDEMVWGGDKNQAGVIKKLVTEDTLTINEKFQPLKKLKNLANFVISSNEDWIVPVGNTSTRWQVLDLDNELATMKDSKEKTKILTDIANVDLKQLAKFLYDRDLTGWDATKIIATDALRYQKLQSMSSIQKWWLEHLNNNSTNFGRSIPKSDMYDEYIDFSGDRHTKPAKFWKDMKELIGKVKVTRPRPSMIRCVVLPELEDCRDIWKVINNDDEWTFEEDNECDDMSDDNELFSDSD
jgi:hypothetical protein